VQGQGQLLDLIYGTVLDPGLWSPVMESLADSFAAENACITRLNAIDGSGDAEIVRADPIHLERYKAHFAPLNPFIGRPNAREHVANFVPWISTEADYLPHDTFVRSEYFNDFMLAADVQGVLMIDLGVRDLDIFTLNLNRGVTCDPFSKDKISLAHDLHPHLIRAFKMGQAFAGLAGIAESRARALDLMGQGVLILDADSHIRHANRTAETIISAREGLSVRDGRLFALHPPAARKLEAMIAIAGSADPDLRRGSSLNVPSGTHALSLTISPLGANAMPVFARAPAVLVTIANTGTEEANLRRKLEELFALTEAEIRVASALFRGSTPLEAAEKFAVSINTVRTQMAGIFAKTGTASQPELSRLMTRLAGQP
jgi:DNA-binding CsgD family transcriptional regulator